MSASPGQFPLFIAAGPGFIALTPSRAMPVDDLSDLRWDAQEYERQNAAARRFDEWATQRTPGNLPTGRDIRQ